MFSVKGTMIYTGREVVRDGFVNVDGTAVASVSETARGEVRGECAVITPALVDPHCHIGMCRSGEPSDENEANERMDSILTLADALDSVQMDDSSFRDSIEAGVLYSCVVPGSGNILAGRSAVIRNYAKTSTDALVARAGIKAAVGYNPMSASDWQGKRAFTRMGSMALLREKLYAVKTKLDSKKEDDKEEHLSREEEVLHDILTGRERLRVHVHKTDDIESMLRLMDELKKADPQFDMRISVEHAGDVHDGHIFGKLRERGIPVVYGPVDSFAYKVELRHEHWRNIRHLLDSGVELGLMTDHPVVLQKMLLFQLRWFVRLGMSKQAALEVVTRRNAEILGLGSLLGTLESGRWASFVCWNGDPFDMTRYPVAVYGEGERLFGAE